MVEAYLNALLEENAELAMRIMTVRQHIAEEICEFFARNGLDRHPAGQYGTPVASI